MGLGGLVEGYGAPGAPIGDDAVGPARLLERRVALGLAVLRCRGQLGVDSIPTPGGVRGMPQPPVLAAGPHM